MVIKVVDCGYRWTYPTIITEIAEDLEDGILELDMDQHVPEYICLCELQKMRDRGVLSGKAPGVEKWEVVFLENRRFRIFKFQWLVGLPGRTPLRLNCSPEESRRFGKYVPDGRERFRTLLGLRQH